MNTIQEKNCLWCEKVSEADIPNLRFCPYCGRPTGRVSKPQLVYSSDSPNGEKKIELQEGDSFAIKFDHLSGEPVTIKCDISHTENIIFKDKDKDTKIFTGQSKRKSSVIFEFSLKDYTKGVTGEIIFEYNNDNRKPDKIWQQTDNWISERYPLNGKILIASKEWIPGSEFLFFSKDIQQQKICIYNPSITERKFEFESPNGYSVYPYSEKYFRMSYIPIKGKSSEIFCIDKEKTVSEKNPTLWKIGDNEINLFKLPVKEKKDIPKSDLKIAFDLGARKISIRAFWRGFPSLDKKVGDIEQIGGESFSPTMLLDKTSKEKYFFIEESDVEKLQNKNKNLIEIKALKTCLRDSKDIYIKHNVNWTNEYLLTLLFSEISKKIKQWSSELYKSIDKIAPDNFNEDFNNPEYIFSYPILETEESTEKYKKILKNAFIRSFGEKIDDSQIKFISEPDAVLNYINSKKQNIKLNEGELFAVVDSGAGTTDLSVGKIKRNNGNLYLTDIKSVTLNLNEKQKQNYQLPQNRNAIHIGGVLIDRILAHELEINARAILNSPNGRDYINYWEARREHILDTEKIKVSKIIKERIADGKKAPLQILNINFDTLDRPTVNEELYGKQVIEPLLKEPLLEAKAKFSFLGTNLENVSTIIMIGGSNIYKYMRDKTIENLQIESDLAQKDEELTKEDRLNAVVEGSILETENAVKKSFVTFIVKDENKKIAEIIKEGEIITQKFKRISLPFDEDTVVLNLYAESKEFWNNEQKKIASARFNASNFTSSDYGDKVYFEISISEKNGKWYIKCDIYAGGYSAVGWDINFA